MRMFLTVLLAAFVLSSASQDTTRLQAYESTISKTKNDEQKIAAIIHLAQYYAVFKLESTADSLTQKALTIAETSSDKDLIFKILFESEVNFLNFWSSEATIERSIQFVKKGLALAQDQGRTEYMAVGNIKLAGLYRMRNRYDEAMEQVTETFANLDKLEADSLKCILYIEVGDIYKAKGEAVPSYKNYNNAFDLAYKNKNVYLKSDIYHRYADLYRMFGDDETAKKYLLTSLKLNTDGANKQGLYHDYIDLARITDNEDYIKKAGSLAAAINSDRYKLAVKRLYYYLLMTKGKNANQTFKYLFSNKDLLSYFKNMGPVNYHWQFGNIYMYASQNKEALYYFSLAENELKQDNDFNMKLLISTAMADAFLQNKDSSKAIIYYQKSFELCRQLNQFNDLPGICQQLGILNAAAKNYAAAYYFAAQADTANRIVQANAAKDKVALLQIDRENSSRETDAEEAVLKVTRRRNLQVMLITIALTCIFGFMLFLGLFAVSKTTIRVTGYFAFISLFEFIIVLIDYPLHNFTHGEPLKIWCIKIAVIALLVPIQNFLEHKLIAFLESRKLLEARQRFSLKNWWCRLKKAAPIKESGGDAEIHVL